MAISKAAKKINPAFEAKDNNPNGPGGIKV